MLHQAIKMNMFTKEHLCNCPIRNHRVNVGKIPSSLNCHAHGSTSISSPVIRGSWPRHPWWEGTLPSTSLLRLGPDYELHHSTKNQRTFSTWAGITWPVDPDSDDDGLWDVFWWFFGLDKDTCSWLMFKKYSKSKYALHNFGKGSKMLSWWD